MKKAATIKMTAIILLIEQLIISALKILLLYPYE
jgi:hypothetical protein